MAKSPRGTEINSAIYLAIIREYSFAKAAISDVTDYYLNAATIVVQLNDFDPTLDLLAPFYTAYQEGSISTPAEVIAAVRALQEHVLRRARDVNNAFYASINAWYTAVGIIEENLPTEFFSLSESAGYPLSF